jgi:hypothetical protein
MQNQMAQRVVKTPSGVRARRRHYHKWRGWRRRKRFSASLVILRSRERASERAARRGALSSFIIYNTLNAPLASELRGRAHINSPLSQKVHVIPLIRVSCKVISLECQKNTVALFPFILGFGQSLLMGQFFMAGFLYFT